MMIRNESKGFTIIELVTVILVLSILGLFTFSFIDNAIKIYGLVREQSPLYADGTYIMERITRELSDATGVITAESSTLTFTTAAHLAPLTPERQAATVTFKLGGKSGTDLLRSTSAGDVIIGRNVTGFTVTRSGTQCDGIITIQLALNSSRDPSIPSFILRTGVVPNNCQVVDSLTGRSFDGYYYETIQ